MKKINPISWRHKDVDNWRKSNLEFNKVYDEIILIVAKNVSKRE